MKIFKVVGIVVIFLMLVALGFWGRKFFDNIFSPVLSIESELYDFGDVKISLFHLQ
jgi:hypothetical protein